MVDDCVEDDPQLEPKCKTFLVSRDQEDGENHGFGFQ